MRHIMAAAFAAGGLVFSANAALANGGAKCFDKGALAYVACDPTDWSGWFLGAHGGYDPETVSGPFYSLRYDDLELEGFVAGGQLAYQEEFGDGFLLGFEIDFSGVFGADDPASERFMNEQLIGIAAELNWLASARLRFGLPQGAWMPFVTGGVALAGYEASAFENSPSNSVEVDEPVWGAVAGGGVEVMLDENWIGGVEGLYYFFDKTESLSPLGLAGDHVTFGDVVVARLRLSYRL